MVMGLTFEETKHETGRKILEKYAEIERLGFNLQRHHCDCRPEEPCLIYHDDYPSISYFNHSVLDGSMGHIQIPYSLDKLKSIVSFYDKSLNEGEITKKVWKEFHKLLFDIFLLYNFGGM